MAILLRIPILALLIGVVSVAMLAPMGFGMALGDWKSARSFFYSAVFGLIVAAVLGLVLANRSNGSAGQELATLLASWAILPVFAALPLTMITPAIGPVGAWFEMVAALTTTGGTIYAQPADLPATVHLWRGLLAWIGGLITLSAAYAILAPRRLGGFEIESAGSRGSGGAQMQIIALGAATPPLSQRLARALRVILPVYFGLTVTLALIFHLLGQGGLSSLVHAMSILSTSGISPSPDGLAGAESVVAEMVAAVFLVFASIRLLYGRASEAGREVYWRSNPELRLMAGLVLAATLVLFARHWLGAITVEAPEPESAIFEALWGAFFTTLSYLTTTGFESASWETARDWSGLNNPGIVLLGLCAVGGGAATTAGGLKLIRAFALVRHGVRELERIAQPVSIIGVGANMRGMMRRGAVIAWAFVMLFFLTLLLTMLGLSAAGLNFESALIGATAALSNTGPVYGVLTESPASFSELGTGAQVVLALAMITGRIEVLALISIFNFENWTKSQNATINRW